MSPTVSPLVPHANPGPSPTQSERGGDTLTRHAHAHAYARARTRTCTHAQGAKLGPDAWGTVGPVPSLPHSLFLVPLVHTLAPPPPPFPQPPPNTVLSSGPLLQPLSPGPLGLLLHVPGSFPHSSATPHSAWHTYISPSAPLPCHPSVFLFSHPFPSRPPPRPPPHTHLSFPLTTLLSELPLLPLHPSLPPPALSPSWKLDFMSTERQTTAEASCWIRCEGLGRLVLHRVPSPGWFAHHQNSTSCLPGKCRHGAWREAPRWTREPEAWLSYTW